MTPAQCNAEKMDNQKRQCRNKRSGEEALTHVKDKIKTAVTSETGKVATTGWNNRLLAATWESDYDEYNAMYVAVMLPKLQAWCKSAWSRTLASRLYTLVISVPPG